MAQGQKMFIFRTPPSLQITNFCMILSTPGGEPSVGSVSEVNHDWFSVGKKWRALESDGGGGAVEASCRRADSVWSLQEDPFNKPAIKPAWTLLGQRTAATFPPPPHEALSSIKTTCALRQRQRSLPRRLEWIICVGVSHQHKPRVMLPHPAGKDEG